MSLIPPFPRFANMSLDFIPEIRRFLGFLRPTLSEFTAGNMFVFRLAHEYQVSSLGDFLILKGRGYDGRPYALPPLGRGDVEGAAFRICEHMAMEGVEPLLFPVPGGMIPSFPESRWRARADRDQADYIYLQQDLATLAGKRLHKRRNRLNKFLREHGDGYTYRPLSEELVGECLELALAWCKVKCSEERPSSYLETEAVKESLSHWASLGLVGGTILVGGMVKAFCLGEPVNDDTFVVHTEKSEPGVEGLAQLLSRDFAFHELGAYRYVNKEQDLGNPGLRRAKEGFQPAFLLDKFFLSPA